MTSTFPYAGPEPLRRGVTDALQRVVDPELALSIVDVGLIYAVTVTEAKTHVLLTMTSAVCPVTDLIIEDIPLRDPALHALGPGFVVSMMMGHAPVILPAVARVKLKMARAGCDLQRRDHRAVRRDHRWRCTGLAPSTRRRARQRDNDMSPPGRPKGEFTAVRSTEVS